MKERVQVHVMAVKDISVEDGALGMANSQSMQPYLAHIEAAITGRGCEAAIRAMTERPLRTRYIWRIASSLRNAFCDFDRASVRLDLATMDAQSFDSVCELILLRRPTQFCMLLRTMLGAHEMEQVMLEAIDVARRY